MIIRQDQNLILEEILTQVKEIKREISNQKPPNFNDSNKPTISNRTPIH